MQRILKFYQHHCFKPGIIGFLLNPYYFVRTSIYRAIQKHADIISGVTLDFGCGSKPYEHLFNSEKYVGLDVDQSGHDHEGEGVDVYYDGKVIPFSDQSFDSCFSSQVFEHVFDLEFSLREIHRVLKPGGKVLFIAPFVWKEHEIPYDFARYSSFGLIYLLEKTGYRVIIKEKDSHFFQVLIQLWCSFLQEVIPTQKVKYINVPLNIIFIFPFTLLGWAIQAIVPKNYDLYFNNVLIAEKRSS